MASEPIRAKVCLSLAVAWGFVFFSTFAISQSGSSAQLDADGITIQFPAGERGNWIDVFAVNLGQLAPIRVDASGRGRIDLVPVPPPRNGEACFFLVSRRSGEIISMSPQKGFRNPFWQHPTAADNAPVRTVAAIRQDLAEFEARVAAAKEYARSQSRRYRNGDCPDMAVAERSRPALAFEGNAARYYGAARCAGVIAAKPLTCAAIGQGAGLANDPAFSSAQCRESLAAAQSVVTSRSGSRELLARHEGIAAAALTSVARNPANRAAIARQCIADVAADSASTLGQWRNDRDQGEFRETSSAAECRKAAEVLVDEEAQRGALSRELIAAQNRPVKPTAKPASRLARDYACAPK